MVMLQTIEHGSGTDREKLERLMAGVAAGEREALAELYDRTRAAVYATALALLKNSHDAQDVTQDTFVRVWDSAPGYRPQGSPMAWMLTVTRNLARMKLRQGTMHVEMDEEQWDAIPANAPDIAPEDRRLLQDALASLADDERQVVVLHAVTGLKHREISAILEMPLATVLSKYHRALKKLKVFMKGDDSRD